MRDCLVVGLCDVALSERLQLDTDLTLSTAVLKARQSKQVSSQQGELLGQQPVAIDTISHKFPKKKISYSRPPRPGKEIDPQPKHNTRNQCKWCGCEPHAHCVCSAKEATCNHCRTMGHYEKVCQKKRRNLHELELSPQDEGFFAAPPMTDDFFMGVLTLDVLNSPLTNDVSVGGTMVRFKVDTGADVTAIPASIHTQLSVPLQTTPRIPYGASRSELKVLGMFKTCLHANQLPAVTKVYVISDFHMPLLSKPTIDKLGLISYHLDTLSVRNMDDLKLTRPLCDMMEPYDAVLREDSCPYSLTVPRHIAIPFLP